MKNSYNCNKTLAEKNINIELAKEAMTPRELEKFEGKNHIQNYPIVGYPLWEIEKKYINAKPKLKSNPKSKP